MKSVFYQIKSLVIKELLSVWRDKKSRISLILPPLLQLFLMAHAVTLEVKNISIGIYNRDLGWYSHELIQRIQGSSYFKSVRNLDNYEQVEEAINTEKVLLSVQIPPDFSRKIASNQSGTIQMIMDGRSANASQIVQGYVSRIIQEFNQEILKNRQSNLGITPLTERAKTPNVPPSDTSETANQTLQNLINANPIVSLSAIDASTTNTTEQGSSETTPLPSQQQSSSETTPPPVGVLSTMRTLSGITSQQNADQTTVSQKTTVTKPLSTSSSSIVEASSQVLSSTIAPPPPPLRIIPEFRAWFNPNLDYIIYNVPCLVAVLSMFLSLMVTALSVAREREMGTFDQLLISPLQPWQILMGKMIPALIIAFTESSMIMVIAINAFNIPFQGSLIILYFSMLIFIMSILGIGLFISSICHSQQQANLGVFIFMVPTMAISGFATPVENMPEWLQVVSHTFPITHFFIIIKGLFLKDADFWQVLPQIWPMAIVAMFTLSLSAWMFGRRQE